MTTMTNLAIAQDGMMEMILVLFLLLVKKSNSRMLYVQERLHTLDHMRGEQLGGNRKPVEEAACQRGCGPR